jgi:hypothetical protein
MQITRGKPLVKESHAYVVRFTHKVQKVCMFSRELPRIIKILRPVDCTKLRLHESNTFEVARIKVTREIIHKSHRVSANFHNTKNH